PLLLSACAHARGRGLVRNTDVHDLTRRIAPQHLGDTPAYARGNHITRLEMAERYSHSRTFVLRYPETSHQRPFLGGCISELKQACTYPLPVKGVNQRHSE